MMMQNKPNSASTSNLSDQIEKSQTTGDISKVGSLKDPKDDECILKGKDFQC